MGFLLPKEDEFLKYDRTSEHTIITCTCFTIIVSMGPVGQKVSVQRVLQLWIKLNYRVFVIVHVYTVLSPLGLPPVLLCYFGNHQGMVLTLNKLLKQRLTNTFKFQRLYTMLFTVL